MCIRRERNSKSARLCGKRNTIVRTRRKCIILYIYYVRKPTLRHCKLGLIIWNMHRGLYTTHPTSASFFLYLEKMDLLGLFMRDVPSLLKKKYNSLNKYHIIWMHRKYLPIFLQTFMKTNYKMVYLKKYI